MRKLYISTAVIAFLLALLTQFPAKVAWSWFSDEAAENAVYLNGIQGPAFAGEAALLTVQSLQVEQLRWRSSYLGLLLARINTVVDGSIDGYPLHSRVSLRPGGQLLRETTAALPIRIVAPLLQLPVVPLSGLLSVDMQEVEFDGQRAVYAEGRAEIRNAQWLLMRPNLELGNLIADISTADEVISAELSSNGPLVVKGQFELQPDGSYTANIQLRSDSGADPRLNNLLKSLGRPANGWYSIKTKGQIPG